MGKDIKEEKRQKLKNEIIYYERRKKKIKG